MFNKDEFIQQVISNYITNKINTSNSDMNDNWEMLSRHFLDLYDNNTYQIIDDNIFIKTFYDHNKRLNVIEAEENNNDFIQLVLYWLKPIDGNIIPEFEEVLTTSFNTYLKLILNHFILLSNKFIMDIPDVINRKLYFVALYNLLDINKWNVFEWNNLIFIIKK